MRLAFAVAAHLEPEILIVDEVLAVGDAEFQKKCLGKMEDVAERRPNRAVRQPQHECDRALCQRVILLERGNLSGIYPDVREGILAHLRGGRKDNQFAAGDPRMGLRKTITSFRRNYLLPAVTRLRPPAPLFLTSSTLSSTSGGKF